MIPYKSDLSCIVFLFVQGCTNVTSVAEHVQQLQPYILVVGQEAVQAYLVVDKKVVDDVSFEDIPYILMAAFFVYNICYPKGCINLYFFLEVVLLKFRSDKASPIVNHLLYSKT